MVSGRERLEERDRPGGFGSLGAVEDDGLLDGVRPAVVQVHLLEAQADERRGPPLPRLRLAVDDAVGEVVAPCRGGAGR